MTLEEFDLVLEQLFARPNKPRVFYYHGLYWRWNPKACGGDMAVSGDMDQWRCLTVAERVLIRDLLKQLQGDKI